VGSVSQKLRQPTSGQRDRIRTGNADDIESMLARRFPQRRLERCGIA